MATEIDRAIHEIKGERAGAQTLDDKIRIHRLEDIITTLIEALDTVDDCIQDWRYFLSDNAALAALREIESLVAYELQGHCDCGCR